VIDFIALSIVTRVGMRPALMLAPTGTHPGANQEIAMQNLTYQRYLQDPSVRAAIDAEVVRLRREAVDQYLFRPILRWLRSLFRPARTADSPVPPRGVPWQTWLGKSDSVVFNDVQDLEIELLSGSLWITQDGDVEDYVLGPWQRFHVRRQGATVVHALKESSIRIAYREAPVPAGLTSAAPRRAGPGVIAAARAFRAGLARAHGALASDPGRQPASAPT
jgi:hypothetical protein